MTDELLLMALETAADRLGIEIRYEACEGRGGMCTLRGRRVFIIDERKAVPDKADVLARGLAELDLEAVYLPPAVRQAIERHSGAPHTD